jgi:hypothetical protein
MEGNGVSSALYIRGGYRDPLFHGPEGDDANGSIHRNAKETPAQRAFGLLVNQTHPGDRIRK